VTLTTLRGIAETGVERISVGALTHSAVALDIALDYLAEYGLRFLLAWRQRDGA